MAYPAHGPGQVRLRPGDMSRQEAERLAAQWKDRASAEMIASIFAQRRTLKPYQPEFSETPSRPEQATNPKEVRRTRRARVDYQSAQFCVGLGVLGLCMQDPWIFGTAVSSALIGVARMFIEPKVTHV